MKQLNISKKTLNKILIHRIIHGKFGTKAIAVIILMMIAFAFIHSEFNMFNFDEDNHGTHDYCEIVKSSIVKVSKNVASSIVNLKIDKSICFHRIDKASEHISSNIKLDFERFYTLQKTTDIYLHNRVFLI